jgi:hypothetical protein
MILRTFYAVQSKKSTPWLFEQIDIFICREEIPVEVDDAERERRDLVRVTGATSLGKIQLEGHKAVVVHQAARKR